jgi:hypothetical protein
LIHVFIEEEKTGFKVQYGEMAFHVSTYEQATDLAIKVGQTLGKIGY